MALAGLAAGLGPRHGGAGVANGLAVGQHYNDEQRQQQFQNEQVLYQNQIREQAVMAEQQRRDQIEADRRQQAFEGALNTIRNEVKTIPDKDTYDQRVEGYANLLKASGYRIDANWLRQVVPYIAPTSKERARKALEALYSNPLVKEQMKADPQAASRGTMKIDLNDDGVDEIVPIQRVMEAAGISLLLDNDGAPQGIAPSAEGPMANLALKASLAQFKAENNRDPNPKEMQGLVEKARKTPKEPKAGGGSGGGDDIGEIVAGIMDGSQPPDMSRMYGKTAEIRAELHRRGYDLTKNTQDWQATQKFMATANGSQQTRMRQAVDNAYHSLDVIDQLAEQWKGGKFPPLNRGRLAAAKTGLLGPEAQKIATQLDAQIADVTSELGNVYMGGNSPTDHALSLAAKNLSADWSLSQLKSMVEQSRVNLKIRQNSMRNVGPVSLGGGTNQYAAPQEAPAPAAAEEWVRDPKTGKMVRKGA
jgi:hypothetical protein